MAKEEGYRSRAAYKLLELQDKLKLLKRGMRVLDLGSFPGGWIQVASQLAGPKGSITGVDLREVEPFPGNNPEFAPCSVVLGDVTEEETQQKLLTHGRYDLVISDLSPHLSGIRAADDARVSELLDTAFHLNSVFLKEGGFFIAKAFPSNDVEVVAKKYQKSFEKLGRTILKSSRNTSNEFYFIGKGYRRGETS